MYQNYTCDQIFQEMERVSNKANQLAGSLKQEATKDQWQMGVGIFLFWPTLLFLEGGDGAQAQEYSQLLGKFEALETVSIQKQCNISKSN